MTVLHLQDSLLPQATLKARHSDSSPALIAAAKPSPQESALVTDLQSKLKALQVWPSCLSSQQAKSGPWQNMDGNTQSCA